MPSSVGPPGNGYARAGHYYVGDHARYTEVSKFTFLWNRLHGISLLVTVPLGVFCLARADTLRRQINNAYDSDAANI
jgi:hypothetical protein